MGLINGGEVAGERQIALFEPNPGRRLRSRYPLYWFKENGRFDDMPGLTGDLGELVSGLAPGRENEDERIMAISVGVALGDLATAGLVYRNARSRNIGTRLDR